MELYEIMRLVGQVAGGAMMFIGSFLFVKGLKKDQWKIAVQGVFLVAMGVFCLVVAVIADITGR